MICPTCSLGRLSFALYLVARGCFRVVSQLLCFFGGLIVLYGTLCRTVKFVSCRAVWSVLSLHSNMIHTKYVVFFKFSILSLAALSHYLDLPSYEYDTPSANTGMRGAAGRRQPLRCERGQEAQGKFSYLVRCLQEISKPQDVH